MKNTLVIILIFISACVTTNTLTLLNDNLPAMQEKVPGITLQRANKGYILYKNKCGSCHRLHRPGEYNSGEWNKNLIEMYPKAKITDEEEKILVRDYLFALSK
jgi:hypothetical protein